MKTFDLPQLGNQPTQHIETPEQLRSFLMMQPPGILKQYKAFLPWYIKVFDIGKDIKIKVYEPIALVDV